jgi:excisionase family DNA binding protein
MWGNYLSSNDIGRPAKWPLHRKVSLARWQSGHAEDCKSLYVGSIPARASKLEVGRLSRVSPSVDSGLSKDLFVDAGEKMITTEEAAEILNVSRSYVVKLMGSGALSAVKVGRYRRLSSGEVRRYKDASMKEREAALNELADISQELGQGY